MLEVRIDPKSHIMCLKTEFFLFLISPFLDG